MTCSRPKALSEVNGNLAYRASERWVGVVILSVHSMEPPISRSDPKTRGKTCCFWLLKGYCTSSAA